MQSQLQEKGEDTILIFYLTDMPISITLHGLHTSGV